MESRQILNKSDEYYNMEDLNNSLTNNQTESSFYQLIQEMKGPIYLSRVNGKFNLIAKIQKLQSKISRSIFDKGQKFKFRAPKEVPDIKFWNQRFYYYSLFDDGIQMDYESKYKIRL